MTNKEMPIQDALTKLCINLIARLDTNTFDDEDITQTIGMLRILPRLFMRITDEDILSVFREFEEIDSKRINIQRQIGNILKS